MYSEPCRHFSLLVTNDCDNLLKGYFLINSNPSVIKNDHPYTLKTSLLFQRAPNIIKKKFI